MRTRMFREEFRLSQKEHDCFIQKVKSSGLSKGEFLRLMINNIVIKEAPPNELPEFVRLLRRLNANAFQIMTQLNSGGISDGLLIRKLINDTYDFEKKVMSVYLPNMS